MEIIVNLEATPTELFDLFFESLKFDIKKATGDEPADHDVKSGFSYEKMLTGKLGSGAMANATISRLEAPFVYEMTYKSSKGVNVVSYTIEEVDEKNIKITYVENYQGNKKMDDLNFKVMNFLFKRSSEKRIKMLLEAMGRHILENRTAN